MFFLNKIATSANLNSSQVSDYISAEEFAGYMQKLDLNLLSPVPRKIAVAVSGGADSMALCLLVNDWLNNYKMKSKAVADIEESDDDEKVIPIAANDDFKYPELIALTVDHHLREESTAEAKEVGSWLADRGIKHEILNWLGNKDAAGLEEKARIARYNLMLDYCRRHDIEYLMLAHHRDDQAETFLIRLARGSGLYGLSAMKSVSERDGVTMLRPLLDVGRHRLHETCRKFAQEWIEDPSNHQDKFTRVRFRKLMPFLAEEGIDSKCISKTVNRLQRAREAVEFGVSVTIKQYTFISDKGYAFINPAFLNRDSSEHVPEEIALRTLAELISCVGGNIYPPRFEKLERLFKDLQDTENFKAATLSGCGFRKLGKNAYAKTRDADKNILLFREEKQAGKQQIYLNELKEKQTVLKWDNRFELDIDVNSLDVFTDSNPYIAAVGNHKWNEAKHQISGDSKKLLAAIPKEAIFTMPALFLHDEIVEIPHLEYRQSDIVSEQVIKDAGFSPPNPQILNSDANKLPQYKK